jgi:hypothetical protein
MRDLLARVLLFNYGRKVVPLIGYTVLDGLVVLLCNIYG